MVEVEFKHEVLSAFLEVRVGVRKILAVLPPVKTASDLQKLLGLDYAMSWRTMRIAGGDDPLEAAIDVPRPGSTHRLLKLCAAQGVSSEILDDVRQSIEGFESLANQHAENRLAFDAMLASFAPIAAGRIHLESKRAAYRASIRLLGRQADTCIACTIAPPIKDGDTHLDGLVISGVLGLRRLDTRSSLRVFTNHHTTAAPSVQPVTPMGWPVPPADNQPHGPRLAIIPEFSSSPFPQLNARQQPGLKNHWDFYFDGVGIGINSAVDCLTACIWKHDLADPAVDPMIIHGGAQIHYPIKTLLRDIFVHKSRLGSQPIIKCETTNAFDQSLGNSLDHPNPDAWIPAQETAAIIGEGPNAARCVEAPEYANLLRHAFDKMQWSDIDDYVLVRAHVQYPIVGTNIVLRVRAE